MIKYNSNTISDWNYGDDNIIKVYRHNAVCYYKVISSGGTTSQTPCFAVVDDISQYQETEFEDVFNKADDSWYKLNNLNQYEKYGLYGSGKNITTYEGKLTVDSGNEYIYSGGSWVYVGEVSGGTAQLPNVPFTVNYNAKNYDSSTQTLFKTSGQLADVDAVITAGTPTVNNGYLTIASGTRASISGYQTYFNRDNNNPNLTIISKQNTKSTGSNGCHLFANRSGSYNWMYRAYSNKLTLHGGSEQGSVAVTTQPVIESVRIDSNRTATYNNYTDNTSSTYNGFNYGGLNLDGTALFAGYYSSYNNEWFVGDFYWIYMSQTTLTDDQVQQVIAYNEGGGGQPIYPIEYAEKADPLDNVTFSSMTEAEEYECPWWGMSADIDNTDYLFCETNEWLTKITYEEVSGEYICENGNKYKKMQEYDRLVDGSLSATTNYITGDLIESASTDCLLPYDAEIEYLENNITEGSQYINTNQYLNQNSFEIGYEINSPKFYWGYVHQLNGSGTWIGIEDNTVFFGNFNNRFTATTSSTENVVIYAKSGVTINGNSYTDKSFSLGSDSINSNPLYIFGRYDFNQHNIETNASAKLKSFYLKVNDELVLDLIPVRVGQVGYMYDKISGQLFGNVGTGNFILGADK